MNLTQRRALSPSGRDTLRLRETYLRQQRLGRVSWASIAIWAAVSVTVVWFLITAYVGLGR